MQNFGRRDGLPGTAYRAGVRGRAAMVAALRPRIAAALADRSSLGDDSILGRMLASLEAEGVDTSSEAGRADVTEALVSEAIFLFFAGAVLTRL